MIKLVSIDLNIIVVTFYEKKELGWQPKYGLKDIIESAWQWQKSHPNGFEK